MKNSEIRKHTVFLAAVAALFMTLLLVVGCEDPGSYGETETVVYGRLQVLGSSTVPPMDDPTHEIWGETVTGGVFVNDSAFIAVTDTIDSLPVAMKAINAGGYLYLRVEWGEDFQVARRSYSVWQNPAVHLFNVNVTFDTIDPDIPIVDTTIDTLFDTWARRSLKVDTLDLGSGVIIYDTTWLQQDRFAVVWDVGDNGAEGADCRSMCHAIEDTSARGDRMYTTGGGHVDVWHWQAGTSDPVLLAADEYWSVEGRLTDAATQDIVTDNFDNQLLQPIFMHQDPNKLSDPFLHATDAVPFDSNLTWAHHALVPGFVLHDNALGSVADIDCFSTFSRISGRWMILMRRALSTGSPDDIDFSAIAPGDSVMISVAFMDRDDDKHYGSRPFYIIFP